MGIISLQNPVVGQPDTTEDVKVQNNFTTLQTVINGNIDATNLSATICQAATINASGQTVKGAFIKTATDTTTSATYTTLSSPDQVANLTLSTNGLLIIYYRALWSCSAGSAANAAIFLNSNQLLIDNASSSLAAQSTILINAGTTQGISSWAAGLISNNNGVSQVGADATTGQAVAGGQVTQGGACAVFAAAGTYTVSVQYKTSSGTLNVSNRKLWVKAENFA